MVSQDAAMHVVRSGMRVHVAAQVYGVSDALMRMRLNVTGAIKRARRLRQKHSA